MPLISLISAVPIGGTIENTLAGSQYEFLPFDSFLEFGLTSAGVVGDFIVDVFSGQDVLLETGAVSILARAPIYPDDFSLNDVAGAGERIKIRVRNSSAGILNFFTALKITPI